MSLEPMPDTATLLRMKADREAKVRASFPRLQTNVVLKFDPTLPIVLRIPWSALVSDNERFGVVRGRLIAQKGYRTAKRAIRALCAEVMQSRPPAAMPLRLVAKVYLPDNRVHDVVNFSKCVHDAMKGTVIEDDRWLHDVRWIRAGVDVDAPRAEIVITPLSAA